MKKLFKKILTTSVITLGIVNYGLACDKSFVTVDYVYQISPGVYQMKVDWCVGTTTAAGGSGGNCPEPDGITFEMAIQLNGGTGVNATAFSPALFVSSETGNTAVGSITSSTVINYTTGSNTVLLHDGQAITTPNQYCYSAIIEFTATNIPTSVSMLGLENDCGATGIQVCSEIAISPAITPSPACSISDLSAGVQTNCDESTNTYTQQVIVTYLNAPLSGTLNVNGQSFAITSSPQTVTLTGLISDGVNVNSTAAFSADGACTYSENNLFTAPQSCDCDFGADDDVIIIPTGDHNVGFTQVYLLTDLNNVIIATSTTGNFGTQNSGYYNAYSFNYETAPTPAPNVGEDIDTMTGGNFCYSLPLNIWVCCGASAGTITK